MPHTSTTPEYPPPHRDCDDCGTLGSMLLKNVAPMTHVNVPLLYICQHCGTLLTIPPPTIPSLGE